MGKNDDRYNKLELDLKKGSATKKKSGFRRKLEIFGLPAKKEKPVEEKSALEALSLPADFEELKEIESAPAPKFPKKRHNPKRRKQLQDKFQDLQTQADNYAKKSKKNPRYSKYDEILKQNRELPEEQKEEIRQRYEATLAKQRARDRLQRAQSRLTWGIVLAVGTAILLLVSGRNNSRFVIEIVLGLLFAFLGARRGYRRWWR